MMERWLTEYLVNAVWQIPLLALGAALLVRLSTAGARMRHRVWLATLMGAVLVPMPRMHLAGHASDSPGTPSASVSTEARAAGKTAQVDAGNTEWMDALVVAEASLPDSGDTGRKSLLLNRTERWYTRLQRAMDAVREPRFSARAMRWISLAILGVVAIALLRLAREIWAAKRLVRRAERLEPDEALMSELNQCAGRMKVTVPEIRVSQELRTPAVVGALWPALLLPEDWTGYGEAELRAVLLHELAHLQRRDYGVNLLCHLASLPVVWHPAVHLVQSRIRRTRELVCDRMAAECEGVLPYTRSLVRLAEVVGRVPELGVGAVGMGSGGVMRERVAELLEAKTEMRTGMRVFRVITGVAVLSGAFAVALSVHVIPAMAGEVSPVRVAVAVPVRIAVNNATAPVTRTAVTYEQASDGPAQTAPNPAPAASPAPTPAPSPAPSPSPDPTPSPQASPADIPVEREAPTAIVVPDVLPTVLAGQTPVPGVVVKSPLIAAPSPIVVLGLGGRYEHRWKSAEGKEIVIRNNEQAEPSADEKRKIEAQLADSQQKIEAAKQQLADAMKHMQDDKWQQQVRDASRRMAEAQQEMQRTRFPDAMTVQGLDVNSPEFKKQMADIQATARINSKEFQHQMEQLQQQMAHIRVEMPQNLALDVHAYGLDSEARRKALQSAIANLKAEQDRLQKELDAVKDTAPDKTK